MIQIEGIHKQLQPLVDKGQLSARKIVALIELKEIVERFAQVPFVPEEEVKLMEKKFGAKPEIITWGDYFQTEVASRYFYYPDEDFEKIVSTIRFDIISSIMIFKNKSNEFKERIKEEALILNGLEKEKFTEDDEQILHLSILLQYYEEMGLEKAEISKEDMEWFESFVKHYEKEVS
ncbi:MAG: hypothetical protein KatS3mg129_1709 [Leptospiraceae bacterium]|nr:MAG: hypothetical protein KatS3mg129_1709 [Leptospiraceae bacterium]